LLREPLLHFLLYGAALFLIGQQLHGGSDTYRIIITPELKAALAKQYAAQFGIKPDSSLQRTILAGWIHDEILYREGIALGLDKHDQVVRERVVQKMKFVMEDVAPPPEPTVAQLEAYYRAHANRYVSPAAATFTHLYFSTESGRRDALRRAQHALAGLASSDDGGRPGLGDVFPDQHDFTGVTRSQVESIFGNTPLAQEVFAAPEGRWLGPYESAYGLHLLYVYARTPQLLETFAEARAAVRVDYLADAQKSDVSAQFEHVAGKFTVVQVDRDPSS